jgi:hypothetical protein
MKELGEIEGVSKLPYDSIEKIRRIICGTHGGVCSDRYMKKDNAIYLKAEDMRKITEQSERECVNTFWNEFKETLFKTIKRQAECRCDALLIEASDDLSKTKQGFCWLTHKPFRNRIAMELESLGYKIEYSGAGEGCSMLIKW